MPTVSRRTIKFVLGLLPPIDGAGIVAAERHAISELERALARRPSPGKKAKKKRDPAVYAAVRSRAKGECEACSRLLGPSDYGEVDHFWGRARSHSIESCWLLCHPCHTAKTNNKPGAAYWLEVFAASCRSYGYHAEAEKARRRLGGIVSVRDAERARGSR